MTQDQHQLSFEVEPHPSTRHQPAGGILAGSVSVGGALSVGRDLQSGDALTITVANADGEVIATAEAEVGGIGFKPIKLKDEVVRTERTHKAKVIA